jgi:DNA polymerase
MVIGEAPGEKEDLSGRAFVGRAGKTFDGVMRGIGLEPDQDMLIANVAKCRPPGNRAPKREEAEMCMPYLRKQMELVKPKVAILLGATALKHLDPSKKSFSMGEETGKFFKLADFPGITFIVFYHPAALLYNSKLKPAMKAHAEKLRTFLEENGIR